MSSDGCAGGEREGRRRRRSVRKMERARKGQQQRNGVNRGAAGERGTRGGRVMVCVRIGLWKCCGGERGG